MELIFDGKRMILPDEEVKLAKKMTRDFLRTVNEESEKQGVPALYYTTLIVANVLTDDYLRALSPELLTAVFNEIENTKARKEGRSERLPVVIRPDIGRV